MDKKWIIVSILVGVALIGGSLLATHPPKGVAVEPEVPVEGNGSIVEGPLAEGERAFSDAPENTWIYPAKVEVTGLYPEARAEEVLSIHNGGSWESQFSVYYEDLPRADNKWQVAPGEVKNWVSINNTSPVIAPDGIADILIVLEVPEDAKTTVDHFGFLVIVEEGGQPGVVHVRYGLKWLVNMR